MSKKHTIILLLFFSCVSLFLGFTAGSKYGRSHAEQEASRDYQAASAPRSSQWPQVRQKHLKAHPVCDVCDTRNNLEVHHVVPFHLNPELELDPNNLMTLCRDHHFLFGHLCDWSAYNIDVRSDAMIWKAKIKNRRYK